MKSYVVHGKQDASLQTIPVPSTPDDNLNEVLARFCSVVQNPTDWKCELPLNSITLRIRLMFLVEQP